MWCGKPTLHKQKRMIFGLIFWYALLCLLLALAIFFASYLLVCPELSAGKLSAYECGFEPYGDARFAFDVRFYLMLRARLLVFYYARFGRYK